MNYPSIPLVLASFLGEASAERLTVKGKTNVTIIIHHDKDLRSRRLEIAEEGQWGSVTAEAVKMFNEGMADTAAVFYPADGDQPVDFGLLLRPNQPPLGLMWTYAPIFDLRMAPDNVTEQISEGVGIAVLQGLLDRSSRPNAVASTGQD